MARNARKEHRDKDRKKNPHHHDKDHKPGKGGGGNGNGGGSATEDIKEMSTQSSQDAMNATPSQHPADPANADAVYTTGPGQAVEYNYTRQGTYSEDYARQQSQQVMVTGNPVAGAGQVVTSGAANNPT